MHLQKDDFRPVIFIAGQRDRQLAVSVVNQAIQFKVVDPVKRRLSSVLGAHFCGVLLRRFYTNSNTQ